MDVSELRKELHDLAERNRDAGQAMGALHCLMQGKIGFVIPTEYYRQVDRWGKEQYERGSKLDAIANNGTDIQVRFWVRVERNRLGEGSPLTLAGREALAAVGSFLKTA